MMANGAALISLAGSPLGDTFGATTV